MSLVGLNRCCYLCCSILRTHHLEEFPLSRLMKKPATLSSNYNCFSSESQHTSLTNRHAIMLVLQTLEAADLSSTPVDIMHRGAPNPANNIPKKDELLKVSSFSYLTRFRRASLNCWLISLNCIKSHYLLLLRFLIQILLPLLFPPQTDSFLNRTWTANLQLFLMRHCISISMP